ncbi:MAG TPA: murein biosynthesis integral membrane protein MurJ [Actinomycetota bacterium]|nr:murein biosynthesis integral membrane protein MurJ [Actinomycetota bacterium]
MKPPETPDESGKDPQDAAGDAGIDTTRSFVRHSAIMSVGTGLSRLTGFIRVAAMAYALGVTESRLADAYNVANTTPNIVYELVVGGILASVFVPVFVERLDDEGRGQAWHTARAVLTFALIVLSGVMVLGILGSGLIIRVYTLGVHGPEIDAERALASFFLKWFMPQIVFYALGAGVATGLLNAHRRFAAPTFAPILNNLIATVTLLWFAALTPKGSTPTPAVISTLQKYVLAGGTTLGVVAMSLVLWPSLRRIGFRWRWTWDVKDAGFRQIVRLARWAFVYVVANQVGYLVVIALATRRQGGYTAYTSAFIFFQLPYAIFAVSIMTALLPSLASRWTERDLSLFRSQLAQGLRGTAFIVVPAAFGYLALAVPIVRLLLQHGVMRAQSTELLAKVLQAFSIGLFSFCAFQLFLRGFYAMQDTRTPALINIFAVALNTAVNFLYFRYLRVEGLALGHATAYTFAAIVAVLILRRRLGGLEGRRLVPAFGRILLGGLATGAGAYLAARWLGAAFGTASLGPQLLQVGGGVVAGGLSFLAVAAAFRMQEFTLIAQIVRSRVGRR